MKCEEEEVEADVLAVLVLVSVLVFEFTEPLDAGELAAASFGEISLSLWAKASFESLTKDCKIDLPSALWGLHPARTNWVNCLHKVDNLLHGERRLREGEVGAGGCNLPLSLLLLGTGEEKCGVGVLLLLVATVRSRAIEVPELYILLSDDFVVVREIEVDVGRVDDVWLEGVANVLPELS